MTTTRHSSAAFTLVEIITVMVIITLVLTLTVGSHLMWKRHTALDAHELRTLTTLSLARQYAITQNRSVTFAASNLADRGYSTLSTPADSADDPGETGRHPATERTLLGNETSLPPRVYWLLHKKDGFAEPELLPTKELIRLTFNPDGSCAEAENDDTLPPVSFGQAFAPNAFTNSIMRRTIIVNPLTGIARPLNNDERKQTRNRELP